jgi:hypothetical protein
MISILNTIRTPPGGIPEEKEWDMKSDSEPQSSDDESNKSDQENREETSKEE